MAPTTPPVINLSLRILWMDLGDEGAAGAVAVAMSERKKQGKKAPGGLKTLKVSNNFGPAGHRNPPCAAKFNSGVRELEFADGTLSPHKKAQGKKAAFLCCQGGCNVEAKAVAEDDWNEDESASVGRPWTG
jgi:hypothetical protein